MNAQERLRQLIDTQRATLRESGMLSREDAVAAIVRAMDRQAPFVGESVPDIITGRVVPNLGGNLALQICLNSERSPSGNVPAGWAEHFLDACDRLAEAEIVLAHCESGFMHLAEDAAGTFDAWITTKVLPASWREREDIEWWASWLSRRYEKEIAPSAGADTDHARAASYLKTMSYQLPYPADAVIGGLSADAWLSILGQLIARALFFHRQGNETSPISETSLVNDVARALDMDPVSIAPAIRAFTLDGENARWHAATPGVATAPLVRIAPDQVVMSLYGLTTEPLFFLLRELRRRDPEDYHNTAHLREVAFRHDLYALFEDKRFVTSEGRLRLRHVGGNLRTDIDAAIFDRKTGTLGLFELKSQDPFARSAAALARQRDNLLYANRQVSGVLDWIKRNGANEILHRLDPRAAKTFRAQKVYPFVLGRYLAPAGEGIQPDPRAAWGTWPGMLRLVDDRPISGKDANPIASLHARLTNGSPPARPEVPGREIILGAVRIRVHPSWAAFQAGDQIL